MSFSVKKILQFPQGGLNYVPPYDTNPQFTNDLILIGGVLQDTHYVWQAKGPVLEVRNTKSGYKVGAWVFGGILKDSNTKIVCVEEIQRPNGHISLLVVGIECTISGGIICIFDVFSSKVIRAIQIKEKISSMYVVDPGIEDLNLPGPLRNFDGILAVGTEGGDVILLDICRQICEESLHFPTKKDELDPSQVVLLTAKHISKIEHYKERSVREGKHLGIHLNAILENTTDHFVLKGPEGEDRIHVNKDEVIASAVYYCAQLTSLLIGYNFGAFQLWDLTSLKLVYTSPVCEEHIPVTNFALQEPTDDPRAFCYIWVSYSNTDAFQTGLPFAVMYALSYESKEYHEGYGYLYQDFHYCNIRFQMELGHIEEHRGGTLPKGGHCIGIQPITKHSTTKDSFSPLTAGDTLALCLVTWSVWFSKSDTQTCCLIFDLNQWYKEQMPNFTKWKDCNNFILRASLSELVLFNGHKQAPILKVLLEEKSLTQFVGVQKLEEHFFPTSYSFNLWILRESDVVLMFSQGLQKYLLTQVESAGPLCLIRPVDVCRQAITIGLTPLFVDILPSRALSIESQREVILNIALEHQLISWLCKCATEWANGSFSSAGCSLDFLMAWAFQRAIVLKNNCDKYCAPLFDYSQSKLDANTSVLLNSCTRQLSGLCLLYKHVARTLASYVNYMDVINENWTRLEMVSMYFEVLQWLVNVGLLPECHPSTYPRPDNSERISAPYPVRELTEFYKEKRAELCILSEESFKSSENLLFIDNLVNRKCGGSRLQNLWQEDGGSGLYPPPSLQSLVRTYLVDGASISHKHSLVIYLFLDLAMALDQSRYSSVVTHLIKFPAVFKVSPSLIKITQAFWQLDHGDFTTAMDQLLDPFVLGEDLQPWHHTIAMRSLFINKQPNFALLYMKIRKPPMSDEKDVLTAISLFIANKMLDEAFYFKKQHQNNNGDKLLTHLFQECSKNDTLHLVLYKCLNTEEEKTFFNYLKSVHNPTSEDLQIFYYLLRSRFVEAFDTHSEIRRKGHDRQGLIGQSQATKTDQIVKIFKTLLPDVNKNLVDYIRRERNDLWKEVQRPTPMSVFVHNINEQVQYKSTLIHAALAKAKHTFTNSLTEKLETEETSFLRTPTVSKNGRSLINPIITPKIIDDNDIDDSSAPSPCKRMRLSPRLSAADLNSPLRTNAQQITCMSIVKRILSPRNDRSAQNVSNVTSVCTPQSILKVRKLVQNRDSIASDTTFPDETGDYQARNDSLFHSTSFRLQPRASIGQTPKHQHVQFDEATRFSSSLSDQSGRQLDTTPPEDLNKLRSSLSSKDVSVVTSNDDDAEMSDEVFYSPDNSTDNLVDESDKKTKTIVIRTSIDKIKEVPKVEISPPKEKEIMIENNEEKKEPDDDEVVMRSPRGRRSYKRSLGDLSPVRSSPRLSKLQSKKSEDDENSNESPLVSEKPTTSDDSVFSDSSSPKPKHVPKIKCRKSLSRKVLENNTFSKRFDAAPKESIVSKEVSVTKSEKITVTKKTPEKSKVTRVESNIQIVDKESFESDLLKSKSHSVSDSVSKKQCLESTMWSDSSLSLEYDDEPDESEELSESLQEYIDRIMDGDKKNSETNKELSKKPLDFEEHASMQQDEDGPVQMQEEEQMQEKDEVEIVPQEDAEEVEVVTNADPLSECVITEPVEESVFASLTPVQTQENQHVRPFEDDADLPSKDVYEDIYDVNEDYTELSEEEEEEERSYNELEMNIFGLEEHPGRNTLYAMNPDSDSSDVPVAEKAFIVDSFITTKETPEDVVVIISDDEKSSVSNQSSSSKSSDSSDYSATTDEDNSNDVSEEKPQDVKEPAFEEGKLVIDENEEAIQVSGYSDTTEENQVDLEDNSIDVSEEILQAIEWASDEGKLVIDESEDRDVLKEAVQESSVFEEAKIEETTSNEQGTAQVDPLQMIKDKEIETVPVVTEDVREAADSETGKVETSERIDLQKSKDTKTEKTKVKTSNSKDVRISEEAQTEKVETSERKDIQKSKDRKTEEVKTSETKDVQKSKDRKTEDVQTSERKEVKQTEDSKTEEVETTKRKVVQKSEDRKTEDVQTSERKEVKKTDDRITEELETTKRKDIQKSEDRKTEDVRTSERKEVKKTEDHKTEEVETTTRKDVQKTEDRKTEEVETSKRKFVQKSEDRKTKEVETSEKEDAKISKNSETEEVETKKKHVQKIEDPKTAVLETAERKTVEKTELPKKNKVNEVVKKAGKTIIIETSTVGSLETEVNESKKRPSKVDKSTDITVLTDEPAVNLFESHVLNTDIVLDKDTVEPIQEPMINEGAERLPVRKKYPSRGKRYLAADDHATSSSDTTEGGETFRKEVVTVQVHASDKDKKERLPAKMRTRQDDAPIQVADIDIKSVASDANKIEGSVDGQDKKKEPVVAKRSRRALSASDTPARTVSRRLSGQDKIDCDPNDSFKLINDGSNLAVKLTLRNKRSASVDEVRTFSRQAALKRTKSTDEVKEDSGKKAVPELRVILEETDKQAKAPRKARSAVNTYTSSRRLTRRQANIIKDITIESEESNVPNISLEVDDIDPIKLLDLDSFEGRPDPDETKVYEPSSPSTSANRRRSRSNSVVTEISTSPSQSISKRGGRTTRSQTKSPVSTGVSTRSRKQSETSSIASEKSETSSPPKRTRKKLDEIFEAPSTGRSTRSRTASISSDKSGLSDSSRKVVRARRAVLAKSELPEIMEEKVAENVDESSTVSKKRKSKKNT